MPIAIVGARLVDAVRLEPIERSALVVDDDGRIERAGPTSAIANPPGAGVIDADGLVLLPGLIDCHAHPALRPGWFTGYPLPDPTDIIVDALEAGRCWVEHGVTTVRDGHGATAGLKRAFAAGTFPGPRLQVSTGPLRSSVGDLTRGIVGVVLPSTSERPMSPADGVDGMRREARRRIAAGADWLKVFTCGWSGAPDTDPEQLHFTVDEMRAAVEEARAAGIRGVMAHTQGPASIGRALDAGIRSIDHGDLIDEASIARMKALDAVLVVQGPIGVPDAAGLVSGETAAYWDHQRAGITAAAEAGVRIALGSDAMGDALPHDVIAHLAACGLGPLGAIRAATIEGARLLGLPGETGSLEPGKRADLLLFDGDPLEHPEQWREPERVVLAMAGGRVLADTQGRAREGR